MTGVNVPLGAAAAGTILGSDVAQGTLPFTGIALGTYLAFAGGLILAGLALRLVKTAGR